MSALATKTPAVEDDEVIFDVASYRLNIPVVDELKATKLDIRFSGSGSLDRTSEDDLALLEAMRMDRLRTSVMSELQT